MKFIKNRISRFFGSIYDMIRSIRKFKNEPRLINYEIDDFFSDEESDDFEDPFN